MDAAVFAKMLSDKHFLDLKKMCHKYSPEAVREMSALVRDTMAQQLPLSDFSGRSAVYLPGAAQLSTNGIRRLQALPGSGAGFGRKAMEEEIHASLKIESIESSRDSIRRILGGQAPRNDSEKRVYGMKCGLDYIADSRHTITEDNLFRLYELAIEDTLEPDNQLLSGHYYRHDTVYVVGDAVEHEGLPFAQVPDAMGALMGFAQSKDKINELHKAAILHFFIAYLHPYFDGNGRMARLLHLWYLVQCGYPSTLFIPISKYIEQSRSAYYRAYSLTEENARLTGVLDVTPFLAYFTQQVYEQLEPSPAEDIPTMELYQAALRDGKITEKEKALWEFVLTSYGTEEFSTKRLEKDFGDAAYATVRTFVQKFEELSLFTVQKYGSRIKYRIKTHS